MSRRPVSRLNFIGTDALCLVALIVVATLAGCGDVGAHGEGGAATPKFAALSSSISQSRSYGYRTLDSVDLANVDALLGTDARVVVSQLSGPPMEFNVVRGVLYFLAPSEQLPEGSSVLRIAGADGREWQVAFDWTGPRAPVISRVDSSSDDSVALVGRGIGANGAVSTRTTAISFRLSGVTGIDPSSTRVDFRSPIGNQAIESWFDWDATTSTLALRSAQVPQFLSDVRHARTATLAFSFSKPAPGGAVGFETAVMYASGSVCIAVKTSTGAPVMDMEGTRFVLRGFNSGMTAVGALDAAGVLSFEGLVADTYEITEVLLSPGLRLTSFATLPSSSAKVSVTITRNSTEPA